MNWNELSVLSRALDSISLCQTFIKKYVITTSAIANDYYFDYSAIANDYNDSNNCWHVGAYTGHQVRAMVTDNMEGTHNLVIANQNESYKNDKGPCPLLYYYSRHYHSHLCASQLFQLNIHTCTSWLTEGSGGVTMGRRGSCGVSTWRQWSRCWACWWRYLSTSWSSSLVTATCGTMETSLLVHTSLLQHSPYLVCSVVWVVRGDSQQQQHQHLYGGNAPIHTAGY